jgi:hypothetical protein
LWQNIRLDMPCLHNGVTGTFDDGDTYPSSYPTQRGANISTQREGKFLIGIRNELPILQSIVDRARSGPDEDVLGATSDYFKRIEDIWGNAQYLTTDDTCNGNNCAPPKSLPQRLSRYLDFRSFVGFTLLPNANAGRWSRDDINEFLHKLSLEKDQPGNHWNELAVIWKDVRDRIRSGALSFMIEPRYSRGDVKFVGDGAPAVHHSCPQPPGSQARIHHVVQNLALPGWETQSERNRKFGMIALTILPNATFRAYRPTILDNFGSYSYFFLPGRPTSTCGTTWKLTPDLRRNSETDHGGLPEWTAIVQNPGINCVDLGSGNPEPAFNLVGLEFGLKHASLFEL